MAGFSGSGCVYMRKKGDDCFLDIGNATQFEILENVTEVQRTSKRCDSFGSALDIVGTKAPSSFNLSFDELDEDNMALLFLGNTAAHTQTGGTSSQVIDITKLGCLYSLSEELISGVTVSAVVDASGAEVVTSVAGTFANAAVVYDNKLAVAETITFTFTSPTAFDVVGSVSGALGSGDVATDFTSTLLGMTVLSAEWGGTFVAADTVVITVTAAAAGTAYTLDTDYTIEAQAGMVNVLNTGIIPLSSQIFVDYTSADLSADWQCVLGSKTDKVEAEIKLIGTNRADNKRVSVTIPKVSLIPASGIDFQGDDFQVGAMTGTVIVCPDQTDAYTVCLEKGTDGCAV